MSEKIPVQSATYLGPITDTTRWQNFKHRPDDIFICTPPKCGTTWTQAICAMLVAGKVDHGTQPGNVSPWIDAQFAPIEDYLAEVEAQTHRRYIKTHSPLDGIPYFPDCTYLVVGRDPRDVFFSSINHRDNMTNQELAVSVLPSGDTAFSDWLNTELEPGVWDAPTLAALAYFIDSYWPFRHLPNIHFFHYSDMMNDLKGNISTMAKVLDVDINDTLLDEMTRAASFDSMKKNAEQFAPESGSGMWKQESGFFATGKNAQWKGKLSSEELAAFDKRLERLLSPEQIAWLLQ